ncbi:LamG domain-containing protein [Acinetobacter chengduensis]|nr:LamG domain-containing protein [Acinetobacter chengduensis]
MTNRLELNWKLDGFVDEQRYYCSETPIDPENLPVPKAVLAGDVRTYVDTDIEAGRTYYVRIGSVKNGTEKLSDEKAVTTEKLLVFMPLTAGIEDFGSLGLNWSKQGSITHSSDGAYFNDDVASWIKQITHDFGSKYKFSIEFKRLIGVSAYLPLVYFTGNVLPRDLGYSSGTPSGESYLVNKVYIDFSYISATAAAQNISNNIWHKLTVERDNRNIKIYIDDVLGLNFNLSESPNSSSVTMLGHAPATTPNKFKGWLRNFKVYDLT